MVVNDFTRCVTGISHFIFDLLKSVPFPGLGVSCLIVYMTLYLLSRLFRLSDFFTHSGDVPDNSNNYIYKDGK